MHKKNNEVRAKGGHNRVKMIVLGTRLLRIIEISQ